MKIGDILPENHESLKYLNSKEKDYLFKQIFTDDELDDLKEVIERWNNPYLFLIDNFSRDSLLKTSFKMLFGSLKECKCERSVSYELQRVIYFGMDENEIFRKLDKFFREYDVTILDQQSHKDSELREEIMDIQMNLYEEEGEEVEFEDFFEEVKDDIYSFLVEDLRIHYDFDEYLKTMLRYLQISLPEISEITKKITVTGKPIKRIRTNEELDEQIIDQLDLENFCSVFVESVNDPDEQYETVREISFINKYYDLVDQINSFGFVEEIFDFFSMDMDDRYQLYVVNCE